MIHLMNIFNLGVKELRSLYRDPIMIVFILFAFIFLVYAAGKGLSQELYNAPIAVVDEDRSPLSHRITNAFYEPYFKTPERIDIIDIDPGMDAGKFTFVIDIPANFQRDVLADRLPELQVNVDATQMTQAFIGASYIQNIITGEINTYISSRRTETVLPVKLNIRMRFNPTLTSSWFASVMEFINMITMLSVILTGAALIREREHGTLEHLLVMPITPIEIMLSKVWSMGLVVLVAAGLSLYFVVEGLLEMPIAGSKSLFLFGVMLHLFSTTSLGILLGTVARSMPQLGILMILVMLPLQMLSGGVTPYESMPELVQKIMQVAPTTYFVRFAQAILYRGASFDMVWSNLLANFAIGIVFFLIALALFRRSLAMK